MDFMFIAYFYSFILSAVNVQCTYACIFFADHSVLWKVLGNF